MKYLQRRFSVPAGSPKISDEDWAAAFSSAPARDEYLQQQLSNTQFEGDHGVYAAGVIDYVARLTRGLSFDATILELGCGDGTGLKHFRALGYSRVLGLDIADHKLVRALGVGFPVLKADMHALPLPGGCCDAVLSAHTLEHAIDPVGVMREACRVLRPGGVFRAIVPYPDPHSMPEVHVAREALGLHPANLDVMRAAVTASGLTVNDLELYASCRSPEVIIWASK